MDSSSSLDEWARKTAKPYRDMFLDMQIRARIADAELDHCSANDFRWKARKLKAHIDRLGRF